MRKENQVSTQHELNAFHSSPADAQRALQKKLQGVLFTSLQKNPPATSTAPAGTQPAAGPAKH